MDDPLHQIDIADPELADDIRATLASGLRDILDEQKTWLVGEIFWAFDQEVSLGHAVGRGCAALMATASEEAVRKYMVEVRNAVENGPTLARILATHLVPVFQQQDESLPREPVRDCPDCQSLRY